MDQHMTLQLGIVQEFFAASIVRALKLEIKLNYTANQKIMEKSLLK